MPNYPLGEKELDSITSKTGKKVTDITLDEIKKGHVHADDIKISREMLQKQGQVAMENGNPPMARSFERASELVDVPDDVILGMYNMLRPNRATKDQLLSLASELRTRYGAESCARLVEEAAAVYEKRGILLK